MPQRMSAATRRSGTSKYSKIRRDQLSYGVETKTVTLGQPPESAMQTFLGMVSSCCQTTPSAGVPAPHSSFPTLQGLMKQIVIVSVITGIAMGLIVSAISFVEIFRSGGASQIVFHPLKSLLDSLSPIKLATAEFADWSPSFEDETRNLQNRDPARWHDGVVWKNHDGDSIKSPSSSSSSTGTPETASLIPYSLLHERYIGSPCVTTLILTVWTLLIFSLVGIMADRYASPLIIGLAHEFHVGDNTAGVILLALGTSSPDILLGVYAALSGSKANTDLFIGDVIGVSLVTTNILLGGIILFGKSDQYKLQRSLFWRDGLAAWSAMVLLRMLHTWGHVSITSSSAILAGWVSYVYIVVSQCSHSVAPQRYLFALSQHHHHMGDPINSTTKNKDLLSNGSIDFDSPRCNPRLMPPPPASLIQLPIPIAPQGTDGISIAEPLSTVISESTDLTPTTRLGRNTHLTHNTHNTQNTHPTRKAHFIEPSSSSSSSSGSPSDSEEEDEVTSLTSSHLPSTSFLTATATDIATGWTATFKDVLISERANSPHSPQQLPPADPAQRTSSNQSSKHRSQRRRRLSNSQPSETSTTERDSPLSKLSDITTSPSTPTEGSPMSRISKGSGRGFGGVGEGAAPPEWVRGGDGCDESASPQADHGDGDVCLALLSDDLPKKQKSGRCDEHHWRHQQGHQYPSPYLSERNLSLKPRHQSKTSKPSSPWSYLLLLIEAVKYSMKAAFMPALKRCFQQGASQLDESSVDGNPFRIGSIQMLVSSGFKPIISAITKLRSVIIFPLEVLWCVTIPTNDANSFSKAMWPITIPVFLHVSCSSIFRSHFLLGLVGVMLAGCLMVEGWCEKNRSPEQDEAHSTPSTTSTSLSIPALRRDGPTEDNHRGEGKSVGGVITIKPYWYFNVVITSKWCRTIGCFTGLMMSFVWNGLLLTEAVACLHQIGDLLSISPSVMGLTLLAFGSSMDEALASLSLSRQGRVEMALGACFGPPLHMILFGIGLASLVRAFNGGLVAGAAHPVGILSAPFAIAPINIVALDFLIVTLPLWTISAVVLRYKVSRWHGLGPLLAFGLLSGYLLSVGAGKEN